MARLFLNTLFGICISLLLLLGANASERPTQLMDLPNELLYEIIEYLDYEGWLAIYVSLGEYVIRVLNAVVSKMVILPAHTDKPIPSIVVSVHASAQQTAEDTASVVSRLGKVLERTEGIKSISLTDLPVNNTLLELIVRHAESLERLTIKFGNSGPSSALRRGWIGELKNLQVLKIYELQRPNVVFPTDFEQLTKLVCLEFIARVSLLPSGAFQHLSGLRYLKLKTDNFQYPPAADIFKPLANLRVLDLWDQTVHQFGLGSFEGLTSLQKLILPEVFSYRIDPGVFLPLEKLTSVKFGGNSYPYPYEDLLFTLWDGLGSMGFALDSQKCVFFRPKEAYND